MINISRSRKLFSMFFFLNLKLYSYWVIGLEKGDGVGLFSLESWVESKLASMGLSCLGDGGNVAERGEVRKRR